MLQSSFGELAAKGKSIVEGIQQKLSEYQIPELLKIASPILLNPEETEMAHYAIDSWKALSGLGPLKIPLSNYINWYNQCDHYFTEKKCRTDRRAIQFVKLRKKLDLFVSKKIAADLFLLAVGEQVSLLESFEMSLPIKKRKKSRKKPKKEEKVVKRSTRYDFFIRKAVQSIILGLSVSIVVGLLQSDLIDIYWSFFLTLFFHLLASIFKALYEHTKKEKRSQKLLGYLLLASYILVFAAPTFQYVIPLQTLGVISIGLLILFLVLTELIVMWGKQKMLESLLDYVERVLTVAAFVIIAYGVSSLIEQPIWVGMSFLSALWAAWNNTRGNNQK